MGQREWDHESCEGALHSSPPVPGRTTGPGARLLELQRLAGNASVGRMLTAQRQPMTPAPTVTPSQLNQQFQQKMGQQPPDFTGAVHVLDQMTDADMEAELAVISTPWRTSLFVAALRVLILNPPPHRVTDVIHRLDGAASRQGRIDYFNEVVGRSEWHRAAVTLNGFSDPDIRLMYTTPALPVRTLVSIRDAALQHMPGWSSRVVDPIHDILQNATAAEMAGMVGSQATWVPSGPHSGNTFQTWASAPSEAAAPPITPATRINCWEMVLLAAYRAGTISWQWIHDSYVHSGGNWYDYMVGRLTPRSRQAYNRAIPGGPAPARGDIVFWEGMDHVGLAVGSRDGAGRVQVYSFWPPPGTPSYAGTQDAVKTTTIEELVDYMEAHGMSHAPTKVEFGPGPW